MAPFSNKEIIFLFFLKPVSLPSYDAPSLCLDIESSLDSSLGAGEGLWFLSLSLLLTKLQTEGEFVIISLSAAAEPG